MTTQQPFTPGNTVNVAFSSSTARIALGAGGQTVRVRNPSASEVFIQFGDSTITASTSTSMPVAPNSVEPFSVGFATYVAAVSTGTGTIYFTTGEGQ